jgi:Tol biopolymer transport system component/DNA-binding winged helix-turn-helix (wHTH) protein
MSDTGNARTVAFRALAFGSYLFDPVRRLLWHEGRVVAITDKAFDLLATLLEHRDRVLQKDELLQRVWPGTFVQENNLVRHISMLRRALGQSPDQHDYIVTVPGVGYRFVAVVTELHRLPADLPTKVIEAPHPSVTDASPQPGVTSASDPTPAIEPSHTALDQQPALSPAPGNGAAALEGISVAAAPLRAPGQTAAPEAAATVRGGTPPTPRRVAIALASVAVLGLLGWVLAAGVFSGPPERQRPRSLRQVTYGPDVQLGPTWSDDGRRIAFSSNRSGDFEIWVQPLDQPDPIRITQSPGADGQPAWSPDGKLIAFRSERQGGGLYVISPGGEGLRRVSEFGYQPRWSPDSKLILFQSGQVERIRPQFFVVGLDGQRPKLARPELTPDWTSVRAAWHPDNQLSFWGRPNQNQWALIKAPVSDGPATKYVVPDALITQMADIGLTLSDFGWASSGQYVYFEGTSQQVRNLWRVRLDPVTLEWAGVPERLTLGQGADVGISLTRDGARIGFGVLREQTRLWSIPVDMATGRPNGEGEPLTSGGSGEFDVCVSDDGRVMVYRTTRFGRQELWARTIADGSQRLLISSSDWIRSSPRLSRDGSRIAYRMSSGSPGAALQAPAVAILETNGTEVVVSAPGSLMFIPVDWSKDDSHLLGSCQPAATLGFSVCTMPVRPNSSPEIIASERDREFFSPHYSPNQRWISTVERPFPRARDWTGGITVIPVSGGARIRLTDGNWNDEKPRWSSDGRAIYFVSNRGGFLNVWGRRFNPDLGKPEGELFQVTRFDDPGRLLPTDMTQVEISTSGNRIFLPITDVAATVWSLDGADR